MPKPGNPYRDNAFAILGLPVSVSTRELVERARRLERRIKAGLEEGDLSLVIEARRRGEDPNQRMGEELFCHAQEGRDDAELEDWVERFGACPLSLGPAVEREQWQRVLCRLPAGPDAGWADPEPIRVTILERGDQYEEAQAPLEPISFAR